MNEIVTAVAVENKVRSLITVIRSIINFIVVRAAVDGDVGARLFKSIDRNCILTVFAVDDDIRVAALNAVIIVAGIDRHVFAVIDDRIFTRAADQESVVIAVGNIQVCNDRL